MNGFSRRWYNPPNLFDGAPLRRMRRRLMRPPDLSMAGQAPDLVGLATPERLRPRPPGNIPPEEWAMLGPGLQSYFTDMYREPSAAPSLTTAPTTAPPELTFREQRGLVDVPREKWTDTELDEYSREMGVPTLTDRKAQEAQRLQELYEGELRPAPDVIRITGPTGREARTYPGMTRREVRESIGLRKLRRGQISPEELAGMRQTQAPSFFPAEERFAPPSFEEDVGRFAKRLPPDLQLARAKHKYAMEHPEGMAPELPRYETTQTFKTPYGTLARKSVTPPSRLDIEQARAKITAEEARTAYWEREPTTTPSPIMRMVEEGLLTLKEGKGLATKERDDDLTEKDVISIMHTIERALASTYTPLNEPLGGEEYAERREYYAQQLEVYKNRLDEIRVGKKKGITEKSITATNPQTRERVISYDGGQTWQPLQ